MIDLNKTAKNCLKIHDRRIKNGAGCPKDILQHCAMEVVEAVEIRGHLTLSDKRVLNDYSLELADIITCALIAAANEDIDIEFALKRVQKKNEGRVVEVEK